MPLLLQKALQFPHVATILPEASSCQWQKQMQWLDGQRALTFWSLLPDACPACWTDKAADFFAVFT